ncbi:TPA: hypothetical protein ACN6WL_002585, partial [Enterococcus faecium]
LVIYYPSNIVQKCFFHVQAKEMILMTRQEKINIVLDARPRLVHIIKCANDDQLDRLVEEVQKELERELDEAAFV